MPLLYNLYVQGHYIKGEEVPQWHEIEPVTRVARATARVRPYNIRESYGVRILYGRTLAVALVVLAAWRFWPWAA